MKHMLQAVAGCLVAIALPSLGEDAQLPVVRALPFVVHQPPDEIYVVDARAAPGSIFQVVPHPAHGGRTLRPVFTRDAGTVACLTSHRYGPIRYVAANGKVVRTTNGIADQEWVSHPRLIRDIGYDSRGRFYLSEATGSGGDGSLYFVNVHRPTVSRILTLRLTELDGYWAGNFAYSPSDKLFVSSGNISRGSLYEFRDGHFVRRFTHRGPITGFAFASEQTLYFTSQNRQLWKLVGFTEASLVHEDSRVEWLTDVAVVFLPREKPGRIAGRLRGGESLWPLSYAEAYGPNAFWRKMPGTTTAVGSDGRYRLDELVAGRYRVRIDVRGDTVVGYTPDARMVDCAGSVDHVDFSWNE